MIFQKKLGTINNKDSEKAIGDIVNHIRYLQDQLEHILTTLDSSNVVQIDTSITQIISSGNN